MYLNTNDIIFIIKLRLYTSNITLIVGRKRCFQLNTN